jgi:hypothetical protein
VHHAHQLFQWVARAFVSTVALARFATQFKVRVGELTLLAQLNNVGGPFESSQGGLISMAHPNPSRSC